MPQKQLLVNQRKVLAEVDVLVDEVVSLAPKMVCCNWALAYTFRTLQMPEYVQIPWKPR